MKPYPKYKDSGIEWLGEVPVEWHITNLRRLSSVISKGTTPSTLGKDMVDEGVRFIKGENIQGGEVVDTPAHFIDIETDDILSRSRLQAHDVLFVIAGSIGKTAIVKESDAPANTNQAICFIRLCNTNHSKYVHYWLSTDLVQQLVSLDLVQTAQPNVSMDDIGRIPLLVADTAETNAIASFLDRETARIDALIQKKERMIELLKEKRIALITQAVTKGLDPNVPMKDSGIEWLGEVPEHWEVLPIKFIVSTPVTDGPHETPEILDEGVPFISAESIKGGKIDFELKRGFISIEDDLRFSKKYKPVIHDIYVIKSGATTGNSAMVETDIEFNIWSPLAVIRCNKAIADPHFVFLYVNSREFITAIQLFWSFGTQQNIGMNIIENLQVPLPPISEQINICKGSKMELERIETLQIRIADSITLLREYRSSLIHHAVTGKIDLREYANEHIS